MRKDKFRELNLLPKEAIFDISLYFTLKRVIFLIFFNLILILFIIGYFYYQINIFNKNIAILKDKLEFVKQMNAKLSPYLAQLKNMKKKISILEKKKNLYYINYDFVHSPLICFLVINQNIFSGIEIKELNYLNGKFTLIGLADSGKDYYKFYKELKKSSMITAVKFYYINLSKENNLLSFKLDIYLKSIK